MSPAPGRECGTLAGACLVVPAVFSTRLHLGPGESPLALDRAACPLSYRYYRMQWAGLASLAALTFAMGVMVVCCALAAHTCTAPPSVYSLVPVDPLDWSDKGLTARMSLTGHCEVRGAVEGSRRLEASSHAATVPPPTVTLRTSPPSGPQAGTW